MNDNSITSAASVSPFLLSGTDDSSTLPAQAAGSNGQNVDAVSQDFEAVFLTQMMSQMFAGDDLTAYFGGGTAGDIYKSYFLNEYGKVMAKAGGIGIAAQVKRELLKLQEVAA